MKAQALSCLLTSVVLIAGCARRAAESVCDGCPAPDAPASAAAALPATSPSTQESEPAMTQPSRPTTQAQKFTGTLRGGIMAIGAETTGWVLEIDGKRIDVDVTKAAEAAASLDGKRVVITGGMTTANWVERGEKPLLIAERIEAGK